MVLFLVAYEQAEAKIYVLLLCKSINKTMFNKMIYFCYSLDTSWFSTLFKLNTVHIFLILTYFLN